MNLTRWMQLQQTKIFTNTRVDVFVWVAASCKLRHGDRICNLRVFDSSPSAVRLASAPKTLFWSLPLPDRRARRDFLLRLYTNSGLDSAMKLPEFRRKNVLMQEAVKFREHKSKGCTSLPWISRHSTAHGKCADTKKKCRYQVM